MPSDAQRRAFSVAVFARHQGRVLLIKHHRLGTWLPPGGEITPGETPLEAAARELREETGLAGRFGPSAGPVAVDGTPAGRVAVDGTPAGLIGYEEHLAGSKGLHMNFAFAADVDTFTVTPNEEFSEFLWVDDAGPMSCPENVKQLVAIALGRAR